jgi:hypothetical protein
VKSRIDIAALMLIGSVVAGCGRPEPQSVNWAETSSAKPATPSPSEAAELSRRAQEKAVAEREQQARDRLHADMATARGAYDIAVAKAQSGHKLAMERCATLSRPEQQPCKDAADRQLASALSQAEQLRPPT